MTENGSPRAAASSAVAKDLEIMRAQYNNERRGSDDLNQRLNRIEGILIDLRNSCIGLEGQFQALYQQMNQINVSIQTQLQQQQQQIYNPQGVGQRPNPNTGMSTHYLPLKRPPPVYNFPKQDRDFSDQQSCSSYQDGFSKYNEGAQITMFKRPKLEEPLPSLVDNRRLEEDKQYWEKSVLCMYYFSFSPLQYSFYVFSPIKGNTLGNATPSTIPMLALVMPCTKYPFGMGCVELGSRIYFIGGYHKVGSTFFASKKVFFIDFDDLNRKISEPCYQEDKNKEPLSSESEVPNMNVGKCNPLVMAVNGKIFVLSCAMYEDLTRAWDQPNPLPGFCTDDWTPIDYFDDWAHCAFEVFDPVKKEWTVLPLPFRDLHWSFGPLPADICGYAVVDNKIFFCTWDRTVHTFDLRTQRWKYYDDNEHMKKPKTPISSYDDALASAFANYGVCGRGLIVNNTLYAFSANRGAGDRLYAYHIPRDLSDTSCHCGPVRGFKVPCLFQSGWTSASKAFQACLFHIGDDKLFSIHGDLQENSDDTKEDTSPYSEGKSDVGFTVFKFKEYKGDNNEFCWSADECYSCGVEWIDENLGSFFHCFAL